MKRPPFVLMLSLAACSDVLGGATGDVRVNPADRKVAIVPSQPSRVRFSVTNTTSSSITVLPCGSATGAYLEDYVDGRWQPCGGGFCISDIATPTELRPGATLADSLVMALEGGTYRIVVPYVAAPGRQGNAVSPTLEARVAPF
jgi:hypothetical protein